MSPDGPALDPPHDGCGPIRAGGPDPGLPLGRQIVDAIRAEGRLARVDLARRCDVSAATISALVADLIAQGLLIEAPEPTRKLQRGRPPTALRPVPGAGHVVGLRLGEFRHCAVLMDFAGRSIAQAHLDRSVAHRDLGHLVDEAAQLFGRLMAGTRLPPRAVLRVGAGLPGFVDHAAGRVDWSPLMPEGAHDLAAALSARLDLPVAIDNDANLLTLAELWFGHGRRQADFAVVTIEQGIGMGLSLGHALYRGMKGFGMELGHTKVQLDGALCRCGQRGCLEAYLSDYALVREASTALDLSVREAQSAQVILDALHDQAKAGHEAARSIFRRAGRYMALGLANVVNLFDPPLIIVSGGRMRYDYLYAEEVLAEMQSQIIQTGRPPPRVEITAWGEAGWPLGAAALALNHATGDLLAQAT